MLQIQHDLGMSHGSSARAEAHALELFALYKHSLSLCKGLDPKEKAPGDDLIPLAVSSLMAARHLNESDDAGEAVDADDISTHHRRAQKRILQVKVVLERNFSCSSCASHHRQMRMDCSPEDTLRQRQAQKRMPQVDHMQSLVHVLHAHSVRFSTDRYKSEDYR